jgi:hypothetical protein
MWCCWIFPDHNPTAIATDAFALNLHLLLSLPDPPQIHGRVKRGAPGRSVLLCRPAGCSVGCSNIDPILQAMLASEYRVSPASLLSLLPASRWVSRDILRYS